MAWTIEVSAAAQKALRKIGKAEAARIIRYLAEVEALGDPRTRGHLLTGNLGGLWRYRIGDWRVISRIEDNRLVIVVITLGHRREIYD